MSGNTRSFSSSASWGTFSLASVIAFAGAIVVASTIRGAENMYSPAPTPIALPSSKSILTFGHTNFDLILINEHVIKVETGPFQERLIFLIEADEFVNAGFNVHTVGFPTGCPAAHLWISFEDKNPQPALGKFKSRGQSRQPGADHDRIIGVIRWSHPRSQDNHHE